MKILVYEYCCARPVGADDMTSALRVEGSAMLSALMADLGNIRGAEPIAVLAEDHPRVAFPSVRVNADNERQTIVEECRNADGTILVAPETAGILEDRCRMVEDAGGRLLGSSSEAVRLASDKLTLKTYFRRRNIPYPETVGLEDAVRRGIHWLFPGVCKPRRGAGSHLVGLVKNRGDLERIQADHPDVEFVLQPRVVGKAASVSFLIGNGSRLALLPAAQDLSRDGCFRYKGGSAPLTPELAERAIRTARKAVASIPGLAGFVGVDVVLGRDPSGLLDGVIEINARLTTSYVGLRVLAKSNLAQAMLRAVSGGRPRLAWHEGRTIRWTADGVCR